MDEARRGALADLLNQNLLLAAQYSPGGWLYENHSRDTGATVVDENGNVVWANENLANYSQDFTNATWYNQSGVVTRTAGFTDPSGGTNACRLQFSDSGVRINQATPLYAGPDFTFSVWLKSNTGSNQTVLLYLYFGTGGTNYGEAKTITPEWQRFEVTASSAVLGGGQVIQLRSSGVGVDVLAYGAQLQRGAQAGTYLPTLSNNAYAPRLQHDSAGTPLGYLHEPQATNHFEEFTLASPTLSLRVTNTESVDDSPVVGQKWRDLILTTDTGAHRIGEDFNVTTGGEYTASFCVKDAGARYVSIPIYPVSGGFAGAVFDLQAGTVTQELGGASGKIEATIDGYRISATATTDGGLPNQAGLCICNSGTPGTVTPSFAGDGTSGIKFTGGQVEDGPVATSLIPTNGAAATRQADLLDRHALGRTLTEGTLYAWFAHYNESPDPSKAPIIGLFESEATYTVGSASIDGEFAGNYVLDASVRDASSSQYRKTSAALTSGQFYKAALAFAAGDCRAALDGTLLGAGSGSEAVPAVTSMSIFRQGGDGAGGSNYPMSSPAILREFRVAPRRMSDAELQTLTS